jgi:K+-sensing histidine kinase KdpD
MKSNGPVYKLRTGIFKPVSRSGILHYFLAALIVIITSAICFRFTKYIGYQSVSFILLFVVSLLSIFMGIGPILLASTLSAVIWNFFFIPPRFTIDIDKTEDALMFAMFFIIALVNGILTSRIRKQEKLTRDREARTNALYQLTKGLADAGNMAELAKTAVSNIKLHFGIDVIILLQDSYGNLTEYTGVSSGGVLPPDEIKIAEWAFRNSKKAGKDTDNQFPSGYTFYPLMGSSVKPGVMAVNNTGSILNDQDEFWTTFLTQISNAIEREFLHELAVRARFLDESDKLYKTLFNSISHELRIPVATIMSASESMITTEHPGEIRMELSFEIFKASARLNRLIENLLNMSRLESGHISPRLDWYDIHDLINKVTDNLQDELKPFSLHVTVSEDMPLVKIDFGLMEQVLYNLLYNATQYASSSSNLRIRAFYEKGYMVLEVLDRGPGFPAKEISLIFNKFYRIGGSKAGGTGLGLSIARGFTEAHKGTITAENRQNGGAKFTVRIPSERPDVEIKE